MSNMTNKYEPVIGLEIHAVLETKSKLFCACEVLDSTTQKANSAVCPVCTGMPGVLPVVNKKVVEFAIRVAAALKCEISLTSIFARKSYFYPDIPKGYQISQYEQPLAINGSINIETSLGEQNIQITRVHLEEDTGKLTHIHTEKEDYSLVDLNRSGMPLLEIVSEPVIHSAESARAYAFGLRNIMRYLGVNSGNLEKGLFRIEPNISIRPIGSEKFGTRVEIKNLNSFRALECGIEYEIKRQTELLDQGLPVVQQTLGWDEELQITVPQRSKEDAEDYRYFPEPDLPPLVLSEEWVQEIKSSLPELPFTRFKRFQEAYQLSSYDAQVLTNEKAVADYFEDVVITAKSVSPKTISNWLTGDLFALMNQKNILIESLEISPQAFAKLLQMLEGDEINQNTAKKVLSEMLTNGKDPAQIVKESGLGQVSDLGQIEDLVDQIINSNPLQVKAYLEGKTNLAKWMFGQVMKLADGKANPQMIQKILNERLQVLEKEKSPNK